MRIVISDFMSLDGVVQAPGGRNEDTDRGFEHGGWSMRYFDPEAMGVAIDEAMATTDALLFGRRTWQTRADKRFAEPAEEDARGLAPTRCLSTMIAVVSPSSASTSGRASVGMKPCTKAL
jgi:hypothetical protein